MVTDDLNGQVVAGNGRDSSKGDDVDRSVSLLKEAVQQLVAELGGQVLACYVDEGCSDHGAKRAAFRDLLAEAQLGEGAFAVVFVPKRSILNRSAEDVWSIEETPRESGIELVSVSEPGDSSALERRRERLIEAFENGMLDLDGLKTGLRRIEAACQRRLQGE